MRKEYDFSKGRRGAYAARLAQHAAARFKDSEADDLPPLTQTQVREIRKRSRDFQDRVRYLLASAPARGFTLYYSVSEDAYGMNEPRYATLFKRRPAAEAMRGLLGDRVQIFRCRIDRRDRLVLNSLPDRLTRKPRRSRRGAV